MPETPTSVPPSNMDHCPIASNFHGIITDVADIKTMLAVLVAKSEMDRQKLDRLYEAVVEGVDGQPSVLAKLVLLERRISELETTSAARRAGLWELAKELAKLAAAAAIGALTGHWWGH